MIVFGLPSARINANPEAAESIPRVTMKSVIRPRGDQQSVDQPDEPTGEDRSHHRGEQADVEHHSEDHRGQRHRRGDGQVDTGGGHDERLADGQHDQDGGGRQHRLQVAQAEERRVEHLKHDGQHDECDGRRPGGQVGGVGQRAPRGRAGAASSGRTAVMLTCSSPRTGRRRARRASGPTTGRRRRWPWSPPGPVR